MTLSGLTQKARLLHFNRKQHDDPRCALRCKTIVEGVIFAGNINKTRYEDEDYWQLLVYAHCEGRPYALAPIVYDKDPRIPRLFR